MKKILFILAIIGIFSCEPISLNEDNCITCQIHVYSLSGAMDDRNLTKVLCTEQEKAEYPEGISRASACNDCLTKVTCK